MSERAYHQSLRLQNFTAFEDASFEFVPGINVFVGENGTGKTHAMKAMYAWQLWRLRDDPAYSPTKSLFQTDVLGDLRRSIANPSEFTTARGVYDGEFWDYYVLEDDFAITRPQRVLRPVYIPAIDMLGHTKGFVSTYDEFAIDFDLTHRDIVSLLLSPPRRELTASDQPITQTLSAVLGGRLELDGERFYIVSDHESIPMPLVAEGLRKFATLLRLIQCGWLRPGAVLFWDEPEVNVNPSLMDELVAVLMALSRSGVQIFLATHSYIMLEELRDASEPGEVRYFGFEQTEAHGVKVHPADDLALLEPNLILRQYESLYERKMRKAFAKRPSE